MAGAAFRKELNRVTKAMNIVTHLENQRGGINASARPDHSDSVLGLDCDQLDPLGMFEENGGEQGQGDGEEDMVVDGEPERKGGNRESLRGNAGVDAEPGAADDDIDPMTSFWGVAIPSVSEGVGTLAQRAPIPRRISKLATLAKETARYEEGKVVAPVEADDCLISSGIYTSSLALAVAPSLPSGSGNYRSVYDPSWGGDRRCDTRMSIEKSATTCDGKSLANYSAWAGKCFGCDMDKEGSHSLIGGNQQILIAADTYFPPLVGSNGNCLPVARIQISTPNTAFAAITRYYGDAKPMKIDPKVRKTLKPPSILIILGLTAHLRRVGVHDYLESMRILSSSLKKTLQVTRGQEVRIGLMVLPFMNGSPTETRSLARDSAYLANIMCIAKESSSASLPLFTGGYLAMLKDATVRKEEFDGLSISVPANCPMIGNTIPIRTSPFIKIKGSLGFTGTPASGAALTPHAELSFLTNLVKEIKIFLGDDVGFVEPELRDLGLGVSEGIPRTSCQKEKVGLKELTDMGVGESDTKTLYKDFGTVVVCGGSEARTLRLSLSQHIGGLKAQEEWQCQIIDCKNTDRQPASEKILKFVSDDFRNVSKDGSLDPIVILKFLDAELMGASGSRLPKVVGSVPASGVNLKRKHGATPSGDRGGSGKIHLESPVLKNPKELVALLKALEHLVLELEKIGANVVIICPMPRHFTPCCNSVAHFGSSFPHDKYIQTVYELSTFIQFLPGLKTAWVLHPGDVVGWGKPSERRIVKEDGVHLKDPFPQIIKDRSLGFIRSIRSSGQATPTRNTVPQFTAESFPMFVNGTRLRKMSFDKPPSV